MSRRRKHMRWGGFAFGVAIAIGALARAAQTEPPAPTPEPEEIDLVEKAERRLVQIDVTAHGPAAEIAALTQDDFEIVVNGERIEEFTVDRLCGEADLRATTAEAAVDKAKPPTPSGVGAPAAPAPTYLIYFDQHHLTLAGRQNALDESRRMIPSLVADGGRVAIASSGEVVDVVIDFTSDVTALLTALDRIESNRKYWDQYPQLEAQRVAELLQIQSWHGQDAGCSKARFLQQEELFRTDKALRRFAMVLGLLIDVRPPKVALYFADTVRRESGRHYYSYVGPCDYSSFNAEQAIDGIIDTATANGIRLYTIQAEGLVTGESLSLPGVSSPGGVNPNQSRIRDAQNALAGMALETGGKSFLNGVAAPKMVKAIHDDVSCVYLISFDGAKFKTDAPLSVRVETKRPKVELQTRGRLVLPSESEMRTTRLLAAFVAPGIVHKDVTLRGTLIPLGFDDGSYRALVQVQAPASPVPNTAWDLGASLVSGGEIRQDASGRLSIKQSGVPVVFESEMRFKPGPYELILVAHDTTSNQLGTIRIDGSWPERGDGPAIGPIAVIQKSAGSVFLRQGAPRVGGSLARADKETVRTDEPTHLLTLVCRGRGKPTLRIARTLEGDSVTEFPATDVRFDDEPGPCVQIRDMIPAKTMVSGVFDYKVRVLDGATELATATQTIYALGPDVGSAGGS